MKKLLLLSMLLYSPLLLANDDIIITADQKVEWHNKESIMKAFGNAKAKNSTMQIDAQELEGHYKKVANKNQLSKIFGFDDVVLTSDDTKGYGNKLEYDITKDEAILFGNPAIIKTPEQTLKSQEKITYYPSKKYAFAQGGVEATSVEGNKIFADTLKAYFKNSNNSSMELDKVDIFDNIKIVTKDATVYAQKGTYYPQSGEIHLFEDVTIKQGQNVLVGSKAVANLKTGVSKLIADPNSKVKGRFKAKQ